jgi:hypothetical protein
MRPAHDAGLAEEMRKGRFSQGTQIQFVHLPHGGIICVDGNHRIHAVEVSGLPQLFTVTYRVCTYEEATKLYSCLDRHRPRTVADGVKAIGIETPHNKMIVAALNVIENRFHQACQYRGLSAQDVADLLQESYAGPAAAFWDSTSGATGAVARWVRNSVGIAVGLVTFRFQPAAALPFWSRLSSGEGLRKGDPELTLLNWFHSNSALGNGRNANAMRAIAFAAAWNAAFKGEPIVRILTKQSFKLLGTPWKDGVIDVDSD